MDIKLSARLKAYGKLQINSEVNNSLPIASPKDAGSFLGVDAEGNYTLFKNASENTIDDLFNNSSDTEVDDSSKSLIDSMF